MGTQSAVAISALVLSLAGPPALCAAETTGPRIREELLKLGARITDWEDGTGAHVDIGPAWTGGIEGLKLLRELPELRALGLTGSTFGEEAVRLVLGLPQLEGLSLDHTGPVDAVFEEAPPAVSLRSLTIYGGGITARGLAGLTRFENLRELRLGLSKGIVGGCGPLGRLVRLESLALYEISDADLEAVAELRGLRELDLSFNKKITAAGLARLEIVGLQKTEVDDSALERISGLPAVSERSSNRTQITDRGLARLRGLPRLRSISAVKSKVTAAGAERLQREILGPGR